MVSGNEELVEDFPEQFRSYSENEKHWQARRTFILRNVPPQDEAGLSPLRVDQLLSLSMVWANHLFLGCRYRPSCAWPGSRLGAARERGDGLWVRFMAESPWPTSPHPPSSQVI